MPKILAIDPSKKYEYVPEGERDMEVPEQTVFFLSMPTAREAASLQDDTVESTLGDQSVMRVKSGTSILTALKSGLKGWKNFKDCNGKDVQWRDNNGNPRPEMFDFIPPELRRELAEVITSGVGLDKVQEKNSD